MMENLEENPGESQEISQQTQNNEEPIENQQPDDDPDMFQFNQLPVFQINNIQTDDEQNEEIDDELNPEEVISYKVIKAPEETLVLQVSILDQPQVNDCTAFVDTGAEVSLISVRCFNELDHEKYPLMSTAYRSVEGIGKVKFPVIGEVIIALKLSANYTLRSSRYIIVPDEVVEYDLVLGYDILKREHLLPDLYERELVLRRGNHVQTVAVDRRIKKLYKMECMLTESVVLKPKEYATVEIQAGKLIDADQIVLVESSKGLPNKVTIEPAVVKFKRNKTILLARNDDDKPKKLKKGAVVGEIEIMEEENPSIQLVELNEAEPSECPEWTAEKIHQAFRLDESNVTPEQQEQVVQLLSRFPSVLSSGDSDVGCTNVIKHKIETLTEEPVQVPVRRLQGPILREIEENCKKMEEEGIIRRSKSPYSAPVVPIRKKDGTIRLCIDYRELNKITKGDSFPIPNLVDMLFSLQGMKFFTTIDLVKGYYQVEMEQNSIEKTAFTTPLSHWEFLRMPFGVKNGPATFQRGMRFALAHIPWNECMVYLDDVLIISETYEKHLEILEKVLRAFEDTGFKIKPSKTFMLRREVQYLGHMVSEKGMVPLDSSLQGIMRFPIPRTIRQLRQFLGMINFYRRHIPNCSVVAKPLFELLGSKTLKWSENCQNAFELLKKALVEPPVLSYPDRSEGSQPLKLYVDASDVGAGACLAQDQQEEERPIAFISTTFSKAERRYSTTEKEVAAIRWAVKSLRPFLYGIRIIIHTDHKPLLFLHNMPLVNPRVARTLEELNNIDYELRYIPGKANIVADALSRSPGEQILEDQSVQKVTEIPKGFTEMKMPGGGDSLFCAFSTWLYGSRDQHQKVREAVIQELMENRVKYGLPTGKNARQLTKILQLMKNVGQFPLTNAIHAFANLQGIQVCIYYGDSKPLKFGNPSERGMCHLLCLGGIHYNLLVQTQACSEEKQPKAHQIAPVKFQEFNLLDESMEEQKVETKLTVEIPTEDKETGQQTGGEEGFTLRLHQIRVNEEDIINPLDIEDRELDLIQDQDPILRRLKRALLRNLPFVGVLKPFSRSHKYIYLRDNRLFREMHTGDFALIVPHEYLTKIAIRAHWGFAHIGKHKLYSLLIQRLWHPKINNICADITSSCYKCQAYKISNIIFAPPTLKIATTRPFELVAMDLIQFPRSARGNQYAVVMVDHFTKWVSAIPLRNKQSSSVASAFKQNILPFLPKLPERLLTDNGREFIGPEFEELLRNQEIKHVLTTPYTPASNGAVERVNRTLSQYLRMAITRPSLWDEDLPQVVLVYNHTVHSETNMTPCENILKRAHTLHTGLPLPKVEQYWGEGHYRFEPFELDQMVGLKVQLPGDLTLNKFKPRYYGPYKIVQIQSNNVTYIIESVKTGKQYRAHHRQLRRWKIPPDYLRNDPIFQQYAMDLDDDVLPASQDEEPLREEEMEEVRSAENEFEEPEEEESLFEGFSVDQEKLKMVKDKLLAITKVQEKLLTLVRTSPEWPQDHCNDLENPEMENPSGSGISHEEELNSYLQWDTSDLLEEAERRWEMSQAMILPTSVNNRESLPFNLNNLEPNWFSTPIVHTDEDKEEKETPSIGEKGESSQFNSLSFKGFDKAMIIPIPKALQLNERNRPYTRSRGACLEEPLVYPYLIERKRRK